MSRAPLFKLLLMDLSENTTKDHIEEIFGTYGEINYIDFQKGTSGRSSKAYVAYSAIESQSKALEKMNGGIVDGAKIKVDMLKPIATDRRPSYNNDRRPYGRDRDDRNGGYSRDSYSAPYRSDRRDYGGGYRNERPRDNYRSDYRSDRPYDRPAARRSPPRGRSPRRSVSPRDRSPTSTSSRRRSRS